MEVLEKAIIRYLKARKELLSIAASYPDHFSGNDNIIGRIGEYIAIKFLSCLLYTSDAADDLLSVDLGGRRIITKKT